MPDPVPPTGRSSMAELARLYDTDKGPYDTATRKGHGYTTHYEREFARFRDEPISLLEVGVHKGASLRLWASWFGPRATIVGVDIVPNNAALPLPDGRTHFYVTNAKDESTMRLISKDHAPNGWSIIVDDGSHRPADQARAFDVLWPLLAPGGLYVIEDLHQSYWPEPIGEGDLRPWLMERLDDCLGCGRWAKWSGVDTGLPDEKSLEWEVASLRFFRNIVIIEKYAQRPHVPLPYEGEY